jgi:hypothetical protein
MLVAFVAALATTVLAGAIAFFIFKHFATDKAARIAAFWLTVGAAGGRYSYSGPINEQAAFAASALAGAFVALFGLRFWLLGQHGGKAPEDNQ